MKFENNAWSIQGVNLLDIARDFGTPVYVYDADFIIAQYQRLTKAFKGARLKVKYAMKALNNLHVLKLLKAQGSGLDCVSIQEVKLGLLAGFSPEEILFTPNCVSLDEIKEAVELGVMIN